MATVPNEAEAVGNTAERPRVNLSRVAGVGLFAVMIVWVLWSSTEGNTMVFWNTPSVILTFGCMAGLLLATFGWEGAYNAFRTLGLGGSTVRDQSEAIGFFRLAAVFAIASGFLGTLIGLIAMLCNMSDPSQIGAGMAIALLTQLYGAMVAVLCCVASGIIARQVPTGEAVGATTRRLVPAAGAAAAGIAFSLLAFGIMLLSIADFGG